MSSLVQCHFPHTFHWKMRQYFTFTKSTCPLLPPTHSLQRPAISNIVTGIKRSWKCKVFLVLLPTHRTLKISVLFSRRVFAHSLTPIFNMPEHRHCRKDSDVDNTKGKYKFVTMQSMGACRKGGAAPINILLETIWRWVNSCKFGQIFSRGETPRYVPKTVETRDGLEALYKENVICSCRDSNDDSRVTKPTSLSRLLREKCKA